MRRTRCPACNMADLVDEGEGLCCPNCLYKPGPKRMGSDALLAQFTKKGAAGRRSGSKRKAA
jgi:hypothetical protein